MFADDDLYVSLAARALTKLGHKADIPQDQRDHLFRFSSNDAYVPFPLWEVFHPSYWKANYGSGAKFKNKIVVVGGSAQILHDVIDTPMHPATPGPSVHLQVIAATVEHEFLRQTPTGIMLGLVPLAGLIGWGVIPVLRRPSLSLLFLITVSVIYFTAARIAYDQSGFLATVPALSTLLLCGGSTLGIDYIVERMEKAAYPTHARALRFQESGQRNPRESRQLLQFVERFAHASHDSVLRHCRIHHFE